MINIFEDIKKIENTVFFSKMGLSDIQSPNLIIIENVKQVFVEPSDTEFKGLYKSTEWLPTSLAQEDPFYKSRTLAKDLIEARKEINKILLKTTRNLNKKLFICPPHDFSIAARNALCFAFRQLLIERHFELGQKWQFITDIYYAGHWPVGYSQEKIIAI